MINRFFILLSSLPFQNKMSDLNRPPDHPNTANVAYCILIAGADPFLSTIA